MTLSQRAEAYAAAFPKFAASHLRVVQEQSGEVLYGTWLGGQDYRNQTRYYGAYPAGYLPRVMSLFPDATTPEAWPCDVLHVFSGSLPAGKYERCDLVQPAEIQASVYALPDIIVNRLPRLVLADPPYSAADAKRYGTPMVDRRRVLATLARVTKPGGHLVWLDTCWPMFSKTDWRTCGRITLVRSTNHRVRLISIFERVSEAAGVPAAAADGRRT